MIEYEWRCETVTTIESEYTERGEVVDLDHADKLADLLERMAISEVGLKDYRYVVCLTRQVVDGENWNPVAYAYVRDGGYIDHEFRDTDDVPVAGVPKRFIMEANKHRETLVKYALTTVES